MDQKKIIITVDEKLAEVRIDKAISSILKEFSRMNIKQWINSGNILVNQEKVEPKTKLIIGQIVSIEPIFEDRKETVSEAMDLSIVFEDDHMIIINKPHGLVVHPGTGNMEGTLQNGLLHHHPALSKLPRAGLIHRLDKNTSGLLIIAKTNQSYNALVSDLQERLITREYRAICIGVMTSGGTVDANLSRDPNNRIRFKIMNQGKRAVTHYRVLKKFKNHTFLGLRLETGRTHQIRAHLAHIQYPLIGDPLYGGRFFTPKGAKEDLILKLKNFKRQALHACLLSFNHPIEKRKVKFESTLPTDMESILLEMSEGSLTKESANKIVYPEAKV
ncbi:23S rRNA pseudouridine(1911/1915/1917) synthase RluD [Gammaproteobacteria bacterium]|jgi:23S rRNA pseudouridine1911/1915/1917 synthase|nr:23S rRNA pseudouridine(1911/1915/1917) synthase RluD [Gammaproteobacteria bacterium]|tara:strand:+ start:2923 stop:3915 length:993 start_codon:yes stop_codon:yes gene_type:complete